MATIKASHCVLLLVGTIVLMQRRVDDTTSFQRLTSSSYLNRIGDESGNFWLGLLEIQDLTITHPAELRVEMEAFNGETAIAYYSHFSLTTDLRTHYQLSISGYSGTAGDAMAPVNGHEFSTWDDDSSRNRCCQIRRLGGWWHDNCVGINPNGQYLPKGSAEVSGITWGTWKGLESLRKIEMFMHIQCH